MFFSCSFFNTIQKASSQFPFWNCELWLNHFIPILICFFVSLFYPQYRLTLPDAMNRQKPRCCGAAIHLCSCLLFLLTGMFWHRLSNLLFLAFLPFCPLELYFYESFEIPLIKIITEIFNLVCLLIRSFVLFCEWLYVLLGFILLRPAAFFFSPFTEILRFIIFFKIFIDIRSFSVCLHIFMLFFSINSH